jgi:predicted ATPase
VEAEAGEIEAALTTIDGVIAETKRTGQQWFDAESYRIRGEVLWKRDLATPAPAEQAFLTAVTIAKQQKARSFELRAALSLARLWRDQGKRENARELLAQVYGWFTEGFDTLDLQEAKALLDELHT